MRKKNYETKLYVILVNIFCNDSKRKNTSKYKMITIQKYRKKQGEYFQPKVGLNKDTSIFNRHCKQCRGGLHFAKGNKDLYKYTGGKDYYDTLCEVIIPHDAQSKVL